MPRVESFDALNAYLEVGCRQTLAARLRGQGQTIGERLERIRVTYLPLPPSPYDACDRLLGLVSSRSLVGYNGNGYSVPVTYGHREVLIWGYVLEIVISCSAEVVARHRRSYPSDLMDDEWALIAPLIPPAKRGGRRREVDVRELMNGILYVLETSCQWRAVPKDSPPKSTVHDYLMLWDWDGTLERVHHALYVMARELEGREAGPSAEVIDSRSVKNEKKRALHRPAEL